MFECIKQSLRAIRQSRLKAFLTVGGIAIGVSSVVIISSIGEMGKSAIDNQLTDMGMDSFVVTGTESNFDGLWEKDLETLKSVPDVRNAMPLINYFTEISSRGENSPAMIWGVNEDADDVIELKTVSGRLINKSDVLSARKVCVVDEQIAMNRYKRNTIVGKEIGISINGRVENFEVIGVVSNGVNLLQNMFGDLVPSFVYIPYTTLSEETNNRYFTQIAVKLDDGTDSDSAFNALSHAVLCQRDEKTEIRVENLLKQKSQMNKIADITSKALSIVAGISLVVSGLSVMTVMLVSVKERLEEKKYFKEHRQKIKLTPADIVFNIFNYLFFALFTLSCFFPFYYIFINTISSNELVVKGLITFWPRELTISNYTSLGQVNDLWNSLGITILRTVIGTAFMVFASALAGYLMTKQEMWHRKIWYRFLVITMYFNAGLVPGYLNLLMLGLTENYLVYIIPAIVQPYNIILVKTSMN